MNTSKFLCLCCQMYYDSKSSNCVMLIPVGFELPSWKLILCFENDSKSAYIESDEKKHERQALCFVFVTEFTIPKEKRFFF